MNVLITGGTGFIGSRLAIKCLENGDSVRILGQVNNPGEDYNKEMIESKGGEVWLGSMTDRDLVFSSTKDRNWVFHLAAAQHEANIPDKRFWEVNVAGTRNILEASQQSGVKRFVHGSTIGVYGGKLKGTLDERSPLKPDNIYGITKLEGEKVVQSFEEKLPVVIVRISETFGPGDRRLVKLFKTIKKNVFIIVGKGENIHHLIYIDDLIQGLLLAASKEGISGEIFVLAGKDTPTTIEMAKSIADELGTSIPKWKAPLSLFLGIAVLLETGLRPFGIQPPIHRRRMDFFRKSFSFSNDKAFQKLGFVPKVCFSEGVKETARWYSEMGYI